ncbi:RNA-dependent RNA polymerase [Cachoeira Porteira virus]|uniref:RNA-directed RNA polymerase L n=1 Tax=Cachoeira Porteira virus TaxID=1138490 RepID=H6VX83_9VIRU|nr:RNA-dependent RNA polymerase [Cachoeira Porteira virus]AEZ35283.1 RNA-dependent RNA polymerase [Cachoeira Porteira virus]
MDDAKYDQYLARINAVRDPSIAKDIDVDLMIDRHNYFGRHLCDVLNIQYRNDVPLIDILLETVPGFDPTAVDVPNITPDNYIMINGRIVIIDYKVSVGSESTEITLEKYNKCMEKVREQLPINYEVAIVRVNPVTNQLYLIGESFIRAFPNIPLNLDFSRFFELKTMLYQKFADNEEFMLKVAHGDFTLTAPWCHEETPELLSHPEFNFFINSMASPIQNLFFETLEFSAYSSERWNSQLHKIKDIMRDDYENFLKRNAADIFNMDGKFERPDQKEIDMGWNMMIKRVSEERDIISNISKQKPSVHFIWSEASNRKLNGSTAKLIFLSNSLQSIKESSTITETMKAIGISMDIDGQVGKYETLCMERKMLARSAPKKIENRKLDPVKIGNALVIWEQQFVLPNELFKANERQKFFQRFLGIGGHKRFNKKTAEDVDCDKPKILDFNNPNIIDAAYFMVNKNQRYLQQESNFQVDHPIIESYRAQITEANIETIKTLDIIKDTNYWRCINDISVLMRNILSISQYNRHNTFRVAMCANDSVYALVFPSSDIKTKRATVVFCTVCIHKKKDNMFDAGALHSTLKLSTGEYISISKAIRLDKERCQRIVSSPGLFILSAILMYNNNPSINIYDVLNFTFYTSLSITKSMLSLTEPSRYMIMNSLAISSHVKDYIAEKFSPYTKTLFSVYMTNLIKKGCSTANLQSKKIQLRNVFLSDYDITQKGAGDERDLESIWFPGLVSLKEYISQIYLPFYFNAKGLHEKHHVVIDLAKTVIEIELDQRKISQEIWSTTPKKEHVNLPILIYSIANNLILDTSRHNHLRNRVENRNNFKRSITTISTFTSSKSCIKIGDFKELKATQLRKNIKNIQTAEKKYRVSNPLFIDDETKDLEAAHVRYDKIIETIPDYKDCLSTKVFDRLYELLKREEINDTPFIEHAMSMMLKHKEFNFTFFNKGQKTAKDREIFVGEFEAKMCMYVIERISKERCKLNSDEMISEPGDAKLRVLEQKAEQELRFIVEKTKDRFAKADPSRALKMEINADMSKWSAQDVFYKYFWLIAMDPILYPREKKRILYFMCNYLEKNLILPDELIGNVLDQKKTYNDDIILEGTEFFRQNYIKIRRNWLQGNFNYISSYIHTCAMSVYKDIIKRVASLLDGDVMVNSMVHSDDNQTSITYIQNKLPENMLMQHALEKFEVVCLTFGCQANMKKTYMTHNIKEFVSLFNIHGEPMSVYGRFLLPSVGDCAYIGPYEDLASRLSAAQQSLKHGCPPSYAWLAISCSHWITHMTYNMLEDQINSPIGCLPTRNRFEIPVELNGFLNAPLYLIALVGLEAGNLWFLIKLLKKVVPLDKQKEDIQTQVQYIQYAEFSDIEILKLKLLRYLSLDTEISSDSNFGETSDMRSRSLLTPRKFTTLGSLNKLISYADFKESMNTREHADNLEYMINNPELLVTKGERKEEFINSILYRYNSKRFKESLSIQSPAQLFIEQILFSHKPIIDYSSIFEKLTSLAETDMILEEAVPIGRLTFPQAYRQLLKDLNGLNITIEDITVIYRHCILNDPLMVTAANTSILCMKGSPQPRVGLSACQMPEFRNMKLIHHSPALVLRAYTKGNTDIPGAEQLELQKDLYHLEEFIKETKIKDKFDERVNSIPDNLTDIEKKIHHLRELTKFYQVCYDYIKSTEHKVKIFILPMKSYTSLDFCTLIQGNTLSDKDWYTMHYMKHIIAGNLKGQVLQHSTSDQILASECFRALVHFSDYFVEATSRVAFIYQVIESYKYKNILVSDLFKIILSSSLRLNFLPLLFRTNELTQADLNKYDALKTDERIAWNNWQTNRSLNSGIIDLTITGYMRSIRIMGNDKNLEIAELVVQNFHPNTIFHAGNRLLNSRHGLKFEYMEEVLIDEKVNYYITYQRKRAHKYNYQISTIDHIRQRNLEGEQLRGKKFNRLVPVCPIIPTIREEEVIISLGDIGPLNMTNYSMARLLIKPEEYATIKKAHMSKMMFFDGPEIMAGIINLTILMRTQELLNLDFDNICKNSILPFCRILHCNGSVEGELIFLSDEVMDLTVSEEIESIPIFTIQYNKKGEQHMTYKNAVIKMINKGKEEIEDVFDFTNDGFYSKKNLGIINALCSIIDLLETNEWSTLIKNAFHIAMISEGMDRQFHLFKIPAAFMVNPASGEINWSKILRFMSSLPDIETEPWGSMFTRFKIKTEYLIKKEMKKESKLEEFLDELEFEEGRSGFLFK